MKHRENSGKFSFSGVKKGQSRKLKLVTFNVVRNRRKNMLQNVIKAAQKSDYYCHHPVKKLER